MKHFLFSPALCVSSRQAIFERARVLLYSTRPHASLRETEKLLEATLLKFQSISFVMGVFFWPISSVFFGVPCKSYT